MLYRGIGNFVWARSSGRGELCGSREKFILGEGGEERGMKYLKARDSAELEKVAPGPATQDLWLGNRKVGSQVVGENRSRLAGRGVVGKLAEEENKEEESATGRRSESCQKH